MVKAPRGFRQDTRKKLRKHPRQRGKVPITRFLQKFEVGDYVAIDIEPSVHDGMPHPKFQGRTGVVIDKMGKAYVIAVKDGDKIKKIVSLPVHLKKIDVPKKEDITDILLKLKEQEKKSKTRFERLKRLLKQYGINLEE